MGLCEEYNIKKRMHEVKLQRRKKNKIQHLVETDGISINIFYILFWYWVEKALKCGGYEGDGDTFCGGYV
jgi:hypothetical protein